MLASEITMVTFASPAARSVDGRIKEIGQITHALAQCQYIIVRAVCAVMSYKLYAQSIRGIKSSTIILTAHMDTYPSRISFFV